MLLLSTQNITTYETILALVAQMLTYIYHIRDNFITCYFYLYHTYKVFQHLLLLSGTLMHTYRQSPNFDIRVAENNFFLKNLLRYPLLAGLVIHSFAHCSFAHFAQIKCATVSDLLRSLKTNERL